MRRGISGVSAKRVYQKRIIIHPPHPITWEQGLGNIPHNAAGKNEMAMPKGVFLAPYRPIGSPTLNISNAPIDHPLIEIVQNSGKDFVGSWEGMT